MTTLYIAGPMTGLPGYNYAAFNEAADRLDGAGYLVLNPVDSEKQNPVPGMSQPWGWYMRHAVRMLTYADALALLPGWQNSRGAQVETRLAEDLGMRMRPVEEWLQATEVAS